MDQHPEDPGEHLEDTTSSTSIHAMLPAARQHQSLQPVVCVLTGMLWGHVHTFPAQV